MRKNKGLRFGLLVLLMMLSSICLTQNVQAKKAKANYLTFTAEEENSSIKFDYLSGKNVQYSRNKGKTWKKYKRNSVISLKKKGETVSFKAKNICTGTISNEELRFSNGFDMTGKIAASGSVTSLTDGQGNNPRVKLKTACYASIFDNCTSLTTAPELPATSHCSEK